MDKVTKKNIKILDLEYGNHLSHPKWNKLCELCNKIEQLKEESKKLRKEIDKDVFNKKLNKKFAEVLK